MLNIIDHAKSIPFDDNVLIYWLGGAGFLIKYSDGYTICIDPYLSDSVERLFGFKRLHRPPITADRLHFDALFITHEHADHLDEDSISALMTLNKHAQLYAPESCGEVLRSKHIEHTRVTAGQEINVHGLHVKVLKADHGELCPCAVGYIFQKSGHTIYLTGDTGPNEIVFDLANQFKPDIILPCINGAFGNLNEAQAAEFIAKNKSAHVIPMHFGLFVEHGGDATKFVAMVKKYSENIQIHILKPGEGIEL